MKPITGPADVKIGDTVSLTTVNSYGVVGTVTKVGADGLTMRTEPGDRRTAKYTRIDASSYTSRRVLYQFTLLTAHDIWHRTGPATPMLRDIHGSARAAAHDLAARTALHAEVDALADWYAVEPEGES